MARDARALLADMRAMEEQKERTNPLSGRRKLNRTQFPMSTDEEPYPMSGAGATPSMGLSQFRGGAKDMGRKFGQVLHAKRGSAYHKEFMEGCGDLMITHKAEGSDSEEEKCGGATRKMGKKEMRMLGEVAEAENAATTLGKMKKYSPLAGMTAEEKEEKKAAAKALLSMKKKGGMGTGATEGKGMSGCGVSDKRKLRGAAVSKLMKQGMTMGEASKHIKENGY